MTEQSSYLSGAYEAKERDYYGGARADYVELLPPDPQARILEVGCGNGATGRLALAAGKCDTYVGVEMFEEVAREAAASLSEIHIGNVDQIALPYPEQSFDALILSEVLEHLVDPHATLSRLTRLVRVGGMVMASSPNISNWKVIADLIKGRFDYQEAGIMDRTHLRWFTPASFRAMFEQAGVSIDTIKRMPGPHTMRGRIIEKILGQRFGHLVFHQINLVGHIPMRDAAEAREGRRSQPLSG